MVSVTSVISNCWVLDPISFPYVQSMLCLCHFLDLHMANWNKCRNPIMWHHTGYCMTHQQGWLYTQMLIPSCLKSRVTGNTDSPTTSAEGAGRNDSQPVPTTSPCICWQQAITAQQKSLGLLYPRFCRRYDLVRILPNLTSSAPPGASSLSSALILLPYQAPCLTSVPLSKQGALCLCTAVGLPPSLPQPGPRPSQHQPSCMFTSDSAKEHIWEHLQALVHNTAVTLSAQKNNVQELLLGTCSRRLQRSCHIIICDLATRLVQVSTEQVSSENSDSNS